MKKELTGTPLIRVLERKCQSIVNGCNLYDWLLCLLVPGMDQVGVGIVTAAADVTGNQTTVPVLRRSSNRRIVLDEPVIMIPIRIPDDVVQDDESFKLVLEFPGRLIREGIVFHEVQHDRGILVPLDKGLEGSDFGWQADPVEPPSDSGKVVRDILLCSRLCPINRRVVQGRAGEFNDLQGRES